MNRRAFVKQTAALAGAALALPDPVRLLADDELFKISVAEWSLNRSIFAGAIDHMDFARIARAHDIDGVEYVNQFFMDKATDRAYLAEMKRVADGEGVQSVLIMCDREGRLGDPDAAVRQQAAENHYKWVDAAKYLGCHSIRVNGYSEGSFDEQMKLVADGLRRVIEYADGQAINVIVENHGGFSSNGQWLAGVMEAVDHPRVGTLPDFGNFRIDEDEVYDSYRGVAELMPYAKGVSVKPRGFDAEGKAVDIDYVRMLTIVLDAGYNGFCGIEYGPEGRELEGVVETRDRLIAARETLAARR